jgi:TRAP-type C4-dicarboxylate transport system permease small subunit
LSPDAGTLDADATTPPPVSRAGWPGGLARIIRAWALLGGLLTLGLAVMTALSALSNIVAGRPFAADYELVKHVIAIAIFMFLPYCQLTGSNVTVDVFTERMSNRGKLAMAAFSALFALAFAMLMLVQMYGGLLGYLRYPEVTPVLKLPLWTAFPPILASLALLALAAGLTLAESCRAIAAGRRGGPRP